MKHKDCPVFPAGYLLPLVALDPVRRAKSRPEPKHEAKTLKYLWDEFIAHKF